MAISERKHSPPPSHQCYRSWNGTSCAMEADIIVEGLQFSEQMHGSLEMVTVLYTIQGYTLD